MKEPVYLSVANTIEEQINQDLYKIKEKLPSERDLAINFGVSRMTARQALNYLEDKGIVYKERGSGTFVQAPSIEQNNVKSFTDTLGELGYEVDTKILEFSTVHKLVEISKELDLPIDTYYYKIKRLRYGNHIPMAFETLYIPKQYLKNLEDYNLTYSFYQLLDEVYDLHISKVSYKMEAVIANPVFSKIMELKKATALLKVSGISYDVSGRKLIFEDSYYRSDLYNYHIDVNRKY